MKLIIKNISNLVTCSGAIPKKGIEQGNANIIQNGYVVIENEIIKNVGFGEGYIEFLEEDSIIIDGYLKTLTPGLIDPHTHFVYSGSREKELELKLQKKSYIEILKSGGGILSTVKSTRESSFSNLYNESKKRLDKMLIHGTTTVESKSGYGLNFQDEVKILEVNKALNQNHYVDIVSTYMGAHAIPLEYKNDREKYISLMLDKVIPYVSNNNLAEFIDCFLEEGVFNEEETRRILNRGKEYNLFIKLHGDEIVSLKGGELISELGGISAEHLVAVSDRGIQNMSKKSIIAVLLPSTCFYLMLGRYAPGRKMIENNLPIAIATDCNPGTSPTENLQNVMTYACFGMGLMPEEIINACTINAACAIRREKTIGSIEVGKKADLVLFDAQNLNYLIYHFGINSVDIVIKNGKIVVENGKIKEENNV